MKNFILTASVVLSALLFSGGCVGDVKLGGGPKTEVRRPTLGQELIDLQKARDAGVITPAEFDAKRAEIMARK
jgi:hypothetical protein